MGADPIAGIRYQASLDGIRASMRRGFFAGWPNPPLPEAHLGILRGSDHLVLALDETTGDVVGFITAISDGVSCAFIPHLEVLPSYRRRGIGTELVRRLLAAIGELYAVDLLCDPSVRPFYLRLGMLPQAGMCLRRYERQSCE